MTLIPKTLTIAGSDSSGGAGIQADLKTFGEYSTYGLAALTTIVTMDPDNGWHHQVHPIDVAIVEEQLKTILAGGEIAAMKTGMLGSVPIIDLVAKTIKEQQLKNIVIDPVMVCKGEDEVLNPDSAEALRDELIPLATVATPNLFEAGVLSGLGKLTTVEDMKAAAKKIHLLGAKNVVIKGGKALAGDKAIDLFYDGSEFLVLENQKITPAYNHGAGCTFAAAITAGLANGLTVRDSVLKAKEFVSEAIRSGFAFNEYVGPVFHGGYRLTKQEKI
ncbi:pyridoxine/pyridoxal/pyridoxamine kinase [Carnobacterium maltaromaticum]|uniref:pyridoxine/pyridoxal/pyridoxamine kinase n=1 Tax=Carnobacterium maltaromaticum TaxID=2751 RepID=UPI001072BFC9|nr:pyridoxine/pyridoxal/pyridoxamine kinase [Carnobacterium maltaromaticum]TFJ76642.1 bifunctional hydroxymethylpyrimidine kinase/phosphomethylpyrimidine kinase [Carnobacterium maltaromaticum]TFJ79442.1 bifunctional hydroxymethylpyrimidine kinase/phosphomethylpyrimidine kinase [Carnobacterium maltaromaticum]